MPYLIVDPVPWRSLIGAFERAEATLTRLDERLAGSPVAEGWRARADYSEASASLRLEGALVPLEDLVLNDAAMDIRAPTAELARAAAVLATRRLMIAAPAEEPFTPAGLARLKGAADPRRDGDRSEPAAPMRQRAAEPDAMASLFADLDAVLARTTRHLAGEEPTADSQPAVSMRERSPRPAESDDDDGEAAIEEWCDVVAATGGQPAMLAAAIAVDAWTVLQPIPSRPWLGPLLGAALLRRRGKTLNHLACLNAGLLEGRRGPTPAGATGRLVRILDGIAAGARLGLEDHDRLVLVHRRLATRLAGRRKNSRMPDLVDFLLAKPIVTVAMAASALDISPQAIQVLLADLDPVVRDITGRRRYRAFTALPA